VRLKNGALADEGGQRAVFPAQAAKNGGGGGMRATPPAPIPLIHAEPQLNGVRARGSTGLGPEGWRSSEGVALIPFFAVLWGCGSEGWQHPILGPRHPCFVPRTYVLLASKSHLAAREPGCTSKACCTSKASTFVPPCPHLREESDATPPALTHPR